MMTCQKLAELLMDFVSGELKPEYRAEIEEHIHICESCDAFVHSYRVTITLTRKLPTVQWRKEFSQKLQMLLQELEDKT